MLIVRWQSSGRSIRVRAHHRRRQSSLPIQSRQITNLLPLRLMSHKARQEAHLDHQPRQRPSRLTTSPLLRQLTLLLHPTPRSLQLLLRPMRPIPGTKHPARVKQWGGDVRAGRSVYGRREWPRDLHAGWSWPRLSRWNESERHDGSVPQFADMMRAADHSEPADAARGPDPPAHGQARRSPARA